MNTNLHKQQAHSHTRIHECQAKRKKKYQYMQYFFYKNYYRILFSGDMQILLFTKYDLLRQRFIHCWHSFLVGIGFSCQKISISSTKLIMAPFIFPYLVSKLKISDLPQDFNPLSLRRTEGRRTSNCKPHGIIRSVLLCCCRRLQQESNYSILRGILWSPWEPKWA